MARPVSPNARGEKNARGGKRAAAGRPCMQKL